MVRDEATALGYLQDAANAQLGVLGCECAGGEQFEAGYLADVRIFIAPDSSSTFAANYPSFAAGAPAGFEPLVENTVGDKSGYRCEAQGLGSDSPPCQAQMLVGSYWVTVSISALAPASASPEFCSNPGATAQVRSIFAAPGLALYPAGKRTFDDASIALAGRDSACAWTDPQGLYGL